MHKKFYITIASHRLDKYKPELVEWLKNNRLEYDTVIVTSKKESMFPDPRVKVVVDDRADTIRAAIRLGKIGVGLRRPWNSNEGGDSLPLFDNLDDIYHYINTKNYIDIIQSSTSIEM